MIENGPLVPLASVTTWLSGGTPDRAVPAYWAGTIPWISAATLKQTWIGESDQHVTEAGVRAGSKLAPAGATLVLVRGMALHKEARIGMATRPVSFNQDVKALVPKAHVLPPYLVYSLQARGAEIRNLVSLAGSGTGVLDTALLKRLSIWLPDKATQSEIVAAIDAADRALGTLRRLIAKKMAIKRAMLQQLLTGKTRLPGFDQPWSTTTLGELGAFLKGRGIKRDDVRRSGVPCLRYGELYTDFANYTSVTRSFVNRDIAATALPIRFGDLLFAGSGETREEIGMCVAYVGENAAVAGGDIVVLRGKSFNPIYLATLANTPSVASQKARAGQGDAVVHISGRALGAIRVEMPPRPEQDAIAEVIENSDQEIDLLTERLRKAESVKQGMMQQLLTGKTSLPVAETDA